MANTFVGIDVAQHQSDLAVRGAEDIDGLPRDQESLEPLSDRLTALAPDRIVMEATSGLEVIWPPPCRMSACPWSWSVYVRPGPSGMDEAVGPTRGRKCRRGTTPGVQLPYAPALNPMDRFFQELRRALAGRVYASLVG